MSQKAARILHNQWQSHYGINKELLHTVFHGFQVMQMEF